MGKDSAISWTHHTFNIREGCTKISDGCTNCYAAERDKRWQAGANWGPKAPRKSMSENYWKQPHKWNAEAVKAGEHRRVFCSSLADVFEDRQDLPAVAKQRERLWNLIEQTPMLDWLLLTKRPENIRKMIPDPWWDYFPVNIWLGVTAENQETFDARVPTLMEYRHMARVLFLSMEPLLGPVDIARAVAGTHCSCGEELGDFGDCATCEFSWEPRQPSVDWVIVGGESGMVRRELDLQAVYEIRQQAAGISFFMKQDSHRKSGQRGRIPDDLWIQEVPA